MAAGISVSYVILRLLPGVNEGQNTILEQLSREDFFLKSFENQIAYAMVLVSFIFFYGMQNYAVKSKIKRKKQEGTAKTTLEVYEVHIITYGLLNLLIGFLLLDLFKESRVALLLYVVAMVLKFIVNDHALHKLHHENYGQNGRWILIFAVVCGWIFSLFFTYSDSTIGLVKAFVAGGALLNVLKEELPEGKENDFSAFALSGLGFAATIIFLI